MLAFAWAWLLYGVLEVVLAIGLPAARARWAGGDAPYTAGATLAMLGAYPLVGAALGALVERALRLRAARGPVLGLLASGSVVGALLGSLALQGDLGASGVAIAALFGALFAVAGADARARGAAGERWPLALPWVVVPIATLACWILRGVLLREPLATRLGATAALFGVGFALAWLARRALARAWTGARGALPGGVAAAAACGVLVAALLHGPKPALPALASPPVAGSGAPVVLIVLDTVRADHLSVYGYARDTDPTLAALAREALVYEQMTTAGDMTLTSHASLFTGQFVSRHGVVIEKPVLADSATTLAERLAAAGYGAYGVSANCGWIGPGHAIDQGFAHWDARCGKAPFAAVSRAFLRAPLLENLRVRFFAEQAQWSWRGAGEITDEALRVLAHAAEGGAPFLLFVNYMDVHRPIHPPREYLERFPGRDPRFDMSADWSALYDEVNRAGRVVTPAERAHLESQYDGALAYIDAQLARLFADLRVRGLWEKSLVVVTSDHGEGFGDHQTFGHGHGVYQDVVHAPLLVKLPGPHAARRVSTPVSNVDVLPTVLAALGLPAGEEVDGVSLLGEIPERRALFAESYDTEGVLARALRRGSEKLVEHRGRERALYDLASDPEEMRDLSAERRDDQRARAAELAAWVKAQQGNGGEATLSPEEAERLRALGYLQ